jgi:hypothetical protein
MFGLGEGLAVGLLRRCEKRYVFSVVRWICLEDVKVEARAVYCDEKCCR